MKKSLCFTQPGQIAFPGTSFPDRPSIIPRLHAGHSLLQLYFFQTLKLLFYDQKTSAIQMSFGMYAPAVSTGSDFTKQNGNRCGDQ
jgi:hypothetical protein